MHCNNWLYSSWFIGFKLSHACCMPIFWVHMHMLKYMGRSVYGHTHSHSVAYNYEVFET